MDHPRESASKALRQDFAVGRTGTWKKVDGELFPNL
jgi:hypothetical protein